MSPMSPSPRPSSLRTPGPLAFLAATALLLAACGEPTGNPLGNTPPAPPMPPHWKQVQDVAIRPADIAPISERLGGEVAALRNTIYEVKGQRVQVNTLIAADDAAADAIWESLRGMKPEQALIRRGRLFHEFVGGDESWEEIVAARNALAGGS